MIQRHKLSGPASIVIWLFWSMFAVSLIFYRIALVGTADNTHSITAPQSVSGWLAYIIPIGLTLPIRWLVIPRLRNPLLVLIPFIAGLAAAEALMFLGIFIFKAQFSLFFLTSVLLLLQMMPLWKPKTNETPRA